jgi:TolB-like protein/Tfp pilus assembly protein PilF
MPPKKNKISQFWQELKRRRVIHVITVYASSAFVIIELINNLAEPLKLPPNLITIVVILLAVGFPVAIILSWLYDLTSEGVEKTKPIEEGTVVEKTVVPNAWRIATYMSFAVIVGLLTFNIVGSSKLLHAGDIQSLLILPFDNQTGDDQLDWVTAGMHFSLVDNIGKISSLRVLGKVTSNSYKETDLTASDIARKHNVDAVIEPTVIRYGDSVCIQIGITTFFPEERVLWMAEYSVEKNHIETLFNQVTKQIADEVMVHLTPGEEQLLAQARIVNSEAYDYYLKGLYNWELFTPESIQLALEYFTKAIEIDPDWALPYAGVAYYWIAIRQTGFAPPSITIPRIYENLEKASKLDPNSSFVQYVSALASVWTELNWEKGEKEFLTLLKINPNDALGHLYYAHLLLILKKDKAALAQANIAIDLDPMNPMVLGLSSMVLAITGEYERAIDNGKLALSLAPGNATALTGLYLAYLYTGEYDKALDAWMSTLYIDKEDSMEVLDLNEKQGFPAAINLLSEKYLNTGHVVPFDLALVYAAANHPSKAMDWIEKAYEDQDASIPYVGMNWFSKEPFKIDDPRLNELLKKMNLPLSIN